VQAHPASHAQPDPKSKAEIPAMLPPNARAEMTAHLATDVHL